MIYLMSRDAKRYVGRHGEDDTSARYVDKDSFGINQNWLRLKVQKLWLI